MFIECSSDCDELLWCDQNLFGGLDNDVIDYEDGYDCGTEV